MKSNYTSNKIICSGTEWFCTPRVVEFFFRCRARKICWVLDSRSLCSLQQSVCGIASEKTLNDQTPSSVCGRKMVADHLHLPLPPPDPRALNDSQLIQNSNPHQTHFKNSSMVLIRDSLPHNDCSVFPPINHENLHPIPQQQQHPLSPSLSSSSSSSFSSSSSSSFAPSDAEYSDPESPLSSETRLQKSGAKATTWVGFGYEVLRSKLLAFASSFGCRWGIQTFGSTSAGIIGLGLMIWSLYMRSRQRRSRENLMQLVKQRDEVSLIGFL